MRMKIRKQFEKKEEKKKEDPKAKLPKLVNSKFKGTAWDWFRFWNQFETEIDQQDNITPVTKYSYLKEFLLPHVQKLVDSLPFHLKATPVLKQFFRLSLVKQQL